MFNQPSLPLATNFYKFARQVFFIRFYWAIIYLGIKEFEVQVLVQLLSKASRHCFVPSLELCDGPYQVRRRRRRRGGSLICGEI